MDGVIKPPSDLLHVRFYEVQFLSSQHENVVCPGCRFLPGQGFEFIICPIRSRDLCSGVLGCGGGAGVLWGSASLVLVCGPVARLTVNTSCCLFGDAEDGLDPPPPLFLLF